MTDEAHQLASIHAGLALLKRAIKDDDPKPELLLRVSDLIAESKSMEQELTARVPEAVRVAMAVADAKADPRFTWEGAAGEEKCPTCEGKGEGRATPAEEIARLTDALERIALLDEADGHELTVKHAFKAVSIATNTLGKHPSQIFSERLRALTLPAEQEG